MNSSDTLGTSSSMSKSIFLDMITASVLDFFSQRDLTDKLSDSMHQDSAEYAAMPLLTMGVAEPEVSFQVYSRIQPPWRNCRRHVS